MKNLLTDCIFIHYQHILDKVRTFDEAIVKIETKFRNETNQERIVSKLESLRFEDYKSENVSPNDIFLKLTSHLEELFPRAPLPFQSQYNKRCILAGAIAGQSWATQTLYISRAELPDNSSLLTALGAVLQKNLELNKKDNNSNLNVEETFYVNPCYGRNQDKKLVERVITITDLPKKTTFQLTKLSRVRKIMDAIDLVRPIIHQKLSSKIRCVVPTCPRQKNYLCAPWIF